MPKIPSNIGGGGGFGGGGAGNNSAKGGNGIGQSGSVISGGPGGAIGSVNEVSIGEAGGLPKHVMQQMVAAQAILQMEPDRITTLATIFFDNRKFDDLMELIDARIFEHKLEVETAKTAFKLMRDIDEDGVIDQALQNLQEEVAEGRSKLNAIQQFFESLSAVTKSMMQPEREEAWKRLFKQKVAYVPNVEAVGTFAGNRKWLTTVYQGNKKTQWSDPEFFNTISKITNIPSNNLKSMSATHLFTQILEDLRTYYTMGGAACLFVHNRHKRRITNTALQKQTKQHLFTIIKDLNKHEHGYRDIPWMGLGKNNSGVDFAYYSNAFNRLPRNAHMSDIDHIAALCSMVATEYRNSAALGRLQKDPNANHYRVAAYKRQPFDGIMGTRSIGDAGSETNFRGSLVDYAITDIRGNKNVGHQGAASSKAVLLLDPYLPRADGSNINPVMTFKEAYLDILKQNPPANNMADFENIMNDAQESFTRAEALMKKLNFTYDINQGKSVLTGRGLFIRVLEEFRKVINVVGTESNDAKKSENLAGLHFLSLAQDRDNHKDSWSTFMKRRLLLFGIRNWNRRRITKVDAEKQVRISAMEGSDEFTGWMEDVNYDHRQFYLMLLGKSWDVSYTVTWGEDTYKDIHGFAALGIKKLQQQGWAGDRWGYDRLTLISGEEMLDVNNDGDETGGFLNGLVDICDEIDKEAQRCADIEGEGGTYIDSMRTTKHGGWDGGLTLAVLIEIYTYLARMFWRSKFVMGLPDMPTTRDNLKAHTENLAAMRGAYDLASQALAASKAWGNNMEFLMDAAWHMGSSYSAFSQFKWGAMSALGHAGWDDEHSEKLMQELLEKKVVGLSTSNSYSNAEMAGLSGQYGSIAHGMVKGKAGNQAIYHKFAVNYYWLMVDDFLTTQHMIMSYGGAGGKQDKGARVMNEILKVAKEEANYDSLFENPGDTDSFVAVPGFGWDEPMAKYEVGFTPAKLVAVLERLAVSDAAPMKLFYACKSMFDHLRLTTNQVTRQAAALRGDFELKDFGKSPPTAEEKSLNDLIKSETGRDLLNLVSYRQLEIAHNRLFDLQLAKEDQGFQLETFSNELILAIKLLLEEKRSNRRGAVIFAGLGPGKVEEYVNKMNAAGIKKDGGYINTDDNPYQPAIGKNYKGINTEFKLRLKDELSKGLRFKPIKKTYPMDITINEQGIKAAFNVAPRFSSEPATFEQLIRQAKYNKGGPRIDGLEKRTTTFNGTQLQITYGLDKLRLVLESFLYKKLAKLMWNHNLEEKDMLLVKQNQRRSDARAVMDLAAEVFGFDNKMVEHVFSPFGNVRKEVREPSSWNIKQALLPTGKDGVNPPRLDEAEFQSFLTIFNSKPMFLGDVENMMIRPSLFDYVFAFYVDLNEFELDVGAIQHLMQYSANKPVIPHNNTADGSTTIGQQQGTGYLMPYGWEDNADSIHLKAIYISAEINKEET